MSRLRALLKDLPAERKTRADNVRSRLTQEQWTDVLTAYDRGASVARINTTLKIENIVFDSEKQLNNAIAAEKMARKRASK